MNKKDTDKVKAITHSVGLKNGLLDNVVTAIVSSPYKLTKKVITELEVGDNLTEEEFTNLKTNFIYAYIGKLYASYNLYTRINNYKKERNGSSKRESWDKENSD